jgi:hypothetical protein
LPSPKREPEKAIKIVLHFPTALLCEIRFPSPSSNKNKTTDNAETHMEGGGGERERVWGDREGAGDGGEMAQIIYAHMNK